MTKFKSVLALALIAFVVVGCGKDKKKNSNNLPYYGYYGNMLQNGAGIQNQQVTQDFFTWLNAVEDKTVASSVPVTYKETKGESCTSFLGMPICGTVSNNTPTYVTTNILVTANQNRISYPGISALSNGVSYIARDSVQANLYEVYVGSGATTKRYIIDTNLHAGLNPRLSQNYDTGKIRELVSQ